MQKTNIIIKEAKKADRHYIANKEVLRENTKKQIQKFVRKRKRIKKSKRKVSHEY